MVFLVVLVLAVVVVALVIRAASRPQGPGGGGAPRQRPPVRPLAPDDDPEFLRELERRSRRDDGSPA